MNQVESLFVATVEELKARLRANSPYSLLKASANIRLLLIDGSPLLHQANKRLALKLSFKVAVNEPAPDSMGMKGGIVVLNDAVDPTIPPFDQYSQDLKLDPFLAVRVAWINGHAYTIKDVILLVANVMGGVHAREPKGQTQEALMGLDAMWGFGQNSQTLHQLGVIGRLVVAGLEPLCAALKAEEAR